MSNIEFIREYYFISSEICITSETNRECSHSESNYGKLHTENTDTNDLDSDSDSVERGDKSKKIPFIFLRIQSNQRNFLDL